MRIRSEHLLVILGWFSVGVVVISVLLLLGFVCRHGVPILDLRLIFGDTRPLDGLLLRRQVFDGLFPAICGTLMLVTGAMGLALPVGLCSGIYMAEYGRGPVKSLFNLLFDILAGIPSIVIGLAGLSLTIFLNHLFAGRIMPSLLVSCLALAMLVLPYLTRATQTALESIDPLIRRTAPALGATRLQNIIRVLLPHALPDITSGIILATGRCAEDTAVIMLTGAVASAGIPRSLFDPYEALPFFIYTVSAQYSGPDDLARAHGAAVLLLLLCSGLMVLALLLKRRVSILLLSR